MATMTFQINDDSTESVYPDVWVTITENPDGSLTFTVTQEGGIEGDLRGIFFDVTNEAILDTLVVTSDSNDVRIGDDSITNLGGGSNMEGLTGTDGGYDVGIEVGTAGVKKDDIQYYEFTLSSSDGSELTLADFSFVDFGARLTSVGMIDGSRTDSSKILELTAEAISMGEIFETVSEDASGTQNIFDGVLSVGTNTVEGWSGGEVGSKVALFSEGDLIGHVTLNADGSYVVDASLADKLSAGEVITFEMTVDVKNQTDATSWSTDTTTMTVAIVGANDVPVATDDVAGAIFENEVIHGDVTANDYDVDRLDTLSWSVVEGSLVDINGNAVGGVVTMNADGSWSYDAQGSLDFLTADDSMELFFQYAVTDGMESDTAMVNFTVMGVDDPADPGTGATGGSGDTTSSSGLVAVDNSYPTFEKDISHAVLQFNAPSGDANGDGVYTVKIDEMSGILDLDETIDDLLAFLVANDENITMETEFLGATIKGGNVGGTDGSYDDFWANDGDSTYTVENMLTNKTNDGSATVETWVSADVAPVDMTQVFQTEVDQTYLLNSII